MIISCEETEKLRWMVKVLLILFTIHCSPFSLSASPAPKSKPKKKVQQVQQSPLEKSLSSYFNSYKVEGQVIRNKIKFEKVVINDSLMTVCVVANAAFGEQM